MLGRTISRTLPERTHGPRPRSPGSNPHSNTVPRIEGSISDPGVIEPRDRVGLLGLQHAPSPRMGLWSGRSKGPPAASFS